MNQNKTVRIECYFDFLSPYSYLAFKLLEKRSLLDRKDIEWDFRPVVLGSLIASFETKGPSEITPKRNYLFKDLNRKAQLENITLKRPAKLPFNSLMALRIALKEVSGDKQIEVIKKFFDFSWGQGGDLSAPEELEKLVANDPLLLELEGGKDARRALKNNNARALGVGAFGVPTFYVIEEEKGELFWGADSISFLENHLAGNIGYDNQVVREFEEGFPFL